MAETKQIVIVTLTDDDGERRHTLRAGDSFSIGRDRTADVVSRDSMVSRRHAVATFDGTTCTVVDSGSKRGLFINGQRVERYEATGTTDLRVADPESGPRLRLTFEDARAEWPVWESVKRRLTVRTLGIASAVMIGILVAIRLLGADNGTTVDERLVTVVASTDAGVIGGGGMLIDGERGLVVTAAVDLGVSGTYSVVIDTNASQVTFAAVEAGRTPDAVVLRLVGLDTVPVLADRLAELDAGDVAGALPDSFDLIQDAAVLGGTDAVELGFDKPTRGDRVAVEPSDVEGLRPWEILVEGDDVVGVAMARCAGSDGAVTLTVASLGELADDVDRLGQGSAGQLAGPAPYTSSLDHHALVFDPYTCEA